MGPSSTAFSWEEIWDAGPYYDRLAELLEEARQSAIIVGWQIDSRLRFQKPFPETLKEKLLRICCEKPQFHFYLLMWDHSHFYCFARELFQGRCWDELHPRIHFVFDNRHPFGSAHHEKLILIDGRIALCGGIDLCDERWDSKHHFFQDPRRSLDHKSEHHGPYHDLAVQVTGPVCTAIFKHIQNRWAALSQIPLPSPPFHAPHHSQGGGGHTVNLSRTHAPIDPAPKTPLLIREIELFFQSLIRKAENKIFIEQQYYWSQKIHRSLLKKMEEMAGKYFQITLILCDLRKIKSLTRWMSAYQLGLLRELEDKAQKTKTNLQLLTPVAHSADPQDTPPKPVYVHSKLMVIDDRFLSIGSANFANRAFRIDTELQLTLEAKTVADHQHIRRFLNQCLKHWYVVGHLSLIEIQTKKAPKFRIHWPLLFDPPVPLAYPFKRFLFKARFLKKGASGMALFGGIALAILISKPPFPEGWIFAALLSVSWALPLPFVTIAILAALHLGPTPAATISVSAFWVAAFLSYVTGRVFPRFARRRFALLPLSTLGPRSFPNLIAILFNPFLSMRTKLAFPALTFIPFSWFLLAAGVIFPGALYVLCHLF